jgi:hypothetical protein
MNKETEKKIGLIQSRGLGDLVIALPIAKWYADNGYEIYWPICEEFASSMDQAAPWVNWIPLAVDDRGLFFYDKPMEALRELGVEEAICLYQSLTGHPEFTKRPEFQITGFDQIKYHIAGVPFMQKWTLADCIIRDAKREQDFYNSVVNKQGKPYVVVHKQGSSYTAKIDSSWIPKEWQVIEVTEQTDSVFDWLQVLEGAEAIIAVDSVISNIVDQLKITESVDCYFIPRSHIHLTPVLGGSWTVLDSDAETLKKISIFKSG